MHFLSSDHGRRSQFFTCKVDQKSGVVPVWPSNQVYERNWQLDVSPILTFVFQLLLYVQATIIPVEPALPFKLGQPTKVDSSISGWQVWVCARTLSVLTQHCAYTTPVTSMDVFRWDVIPHLFKTTISFRCHGSNEVSIIGTRGLRMGFGKADSDTAVVQHIKKCS